MRQRIRPIFIMLCTALVGSVARAKDFNSLGFGEAVPEIDGMGSVAALTVIGAAGYGVSKIYYKIVGRKRD